MRVDGNVKKALDTYCINNGIKYCKLAEKFGISSAAISKWRNVGGGIADKYWTLLFPLIKEYLPADHIFVDESGIEVYFKTVSKVANIIVKFNVTAINRITSVFAGCFILQVITGEIIIYNFPRFIDAVCRKRFVHSLFSLFC